MIKQQMKRILNGCGDLSVILTKNNTKYIKANRPKIIPKLEIISAKILTVI
jgi:hypothetical protein